MSEPWNYPQYCKACGCRIDRHGEEEYCEDCLADKEDMQNEQEIYDEKEKLAKEKIEQEHLELELEHNGDDEIHLYR